MSDDYVGTHMSGQKVSKEESLENLRSGNYQYHNFTELSPVEVQVNGDEATLTVSADVDATINGTHGTWRMTLNNTYRYENGRWLCAAATAIRG